MVTARQVADFFLSKTDESIGENITHLKLQKLVYYAQGFHLALYGEPLFNETIEAWEHGPVVPTLYQDLKQYGASPIPATDTDRAIKPFTDEQFSLLEDVYEVYGQFSAWKLRNLTHKEPTWGDAYPQGTIHNEAMQSYFKTQLSN